MIKIYYLITKPGIILGNIITTAAGFVLASNGVIDYWLFLATLLGLAFVIASACVFNNYIDREMDAKMSRTKNRPLVKGLISAKKALLFATFLVTLGAVILAYYTNAMTVAIALLGFFIYVVLYSILKYRSVHATAIGSISGATPPLVGYCAVSHHFDLAAILLFLIIVLWQMPHFFAIAAYRLEDYKAASIPVLPVKKGMYVTKIQMLLYIVAFMAAAAMLTFFGYMGYVYLLVAALLGTVWLVQCFKGFKSQNDHLWAKQMFLTSLIVITVLCVMIPMDAV